MMWEHFRPQVLTFALLVCFSDPFWSTEMFISFVFMVEKGMREVLIVQTSSRLLITGFKDRKSYLKGEDICQINRQICFSDL